MPRIFDNIDEKILPALQQTLTLSKRADFCVGYFNLRGWHYLAPCIEGWSGMPDNTCRLIVGMHRTPKEELRSLYRVDKEAAVTQSVVNQRKKELAADFHQQLIVGMPTARDEVGLRQLAKQLRAKKLTVKLFLRHALHAKLYLLYRSDPINPIVGYMGSSNLTFSGLSGQGELNIDVLDGDAARKLSRWFEDRWNDQYCIDISLELAEIIETSWAREKDLEPYHVYLIETSWRMRRIFSPHSRLIPPHYL